MPNEEAAKPVEETTENQEPQEEKSNTVLEYYEFDYDGSDDDDDYDEDDCEDNGCEEAEKEIVIDSVVFSPTIIFNVTIDGKRQ